MIWLVDILRVIYLIRIQGKRYYVYINFSYILWSSSSSLKEKLFRKEINWKKIKIKRIYINWKIKIRKRGGTNRIKFRVNDWTSKLASGLSTISRWEFAGWYTVSSTATINRWTKIYDSGSGFGLNALTCINPNTRASTAGETRPSVFPFPCFGPVCNLIDPWSRLVACEERGTI